MTASTHEEHGGLAVKICCIGSVGEAETAMAAGADALGLVSAMPSGPGVIDEASIGAIIATVAGRAATFLLTSLTEAGAIVAQHRRCPASHLQLVDAVSAPALRELREALPETKLVQVIHVRDAASVDEALAAAPHVDALLLDSGNPGLSVKELGGTGRRHDWTVSAAIVAQAPRPVFLAGGLHAGNVTEAVDTVRPYGLDICTGVRSDGLLDPERLGAFIGAARRAAA